MDVLYKYVTKDRIMTCLPEVGDGTLRATQPLAMNDPFECHIINLFTHLKAEEEQKDSWLSEVLTALNPTSPVNKEDVTLARCKHGSFHVRQLLAEQISRRFGIVSFSTDPFHTLMWAHYTVDASGFVIRYDSEIIETLGTGENALQQVDYSGIAPPVLYPQMLDEGNVYTIMTTKGHPWRYEAEWRLIVELRATIGTGKRDPHSQPINLVQVPNNAVKSVYFTERTPRDTVARVQCRLNNPTNGYNEDVRLEKLSLSETSYRFVLPQGKSE